MIKRLTAVILLLACFLLSSCRSEKEAIWQPPQNDPGQNQEGQKNEGDPSEPEIDGTPDNEAEPSISLLDLSIIEQDGMTVEHVFMASEDIIFIFTSKYQNGTVSEQSYLYTYSLNQGAFIKKKAPLGVIGQYPKYIQDDGTVALCLVNSETYAYSSLCFIEPVSLSFKEYGLSHINGVRSALPSPDRSCVAVSTSNGLYIMDDELLDIMQSYEAYVPEGGDVLLDTRLPSGAAWLWDSSGVLGNLLGWEWVYYPFILQSDGSVKAFEDMNGLNAASYGSSQLLFYDSQQMTVSGIYDLSTQTLTPFNLEGLPSESQLSYISCLAVSKYGKMLAAAAVYSDGSPSEVFFYCDGDLICSFRPQESSDSSAIEYVSFSPSGNTAVMQTSSTIDSPKQVYITSFPDIW